MTDPDRAFLSADEPFGLFAAWLKDATAAEPCDPNAMALATVDELGLPNVRMVLLKGYDPGGFVFYTNLESAKGRELRNNPVAALLFHWKSLGRQVRARGPVQRVSDEEANAYFATRARISRLGAWASRQSRPLDARATLEAAVADAEQRFGSGEIPRPPHWSGFRLAPQAMEFWKDGPFRLHDRVTFTRLSAETGVPWNKGFLQP